MKIEADYQISAISKSKWHNGPKGCKYRFHYGEGMTIEWDGEKPPLKAKAFWMRYARNRDAFLASFVPSGKVALSICAFTGTAKVIKGEAGK
jgi:hypothetical protein